MKELFDRSTPWLSFKTNEFLPLSIKLKKQKTDETNKILNKIGWYFLNETYKVLHNGTVLVIRNSIRIVCTTDNMILKGFSF